MAVVLPLIYAGAALATAATAAANSLSGPDNVETPYAPPNPVESEIAKLQLNIARGLREQIDDPRVLESIYNQLPDTKMSEADRSAFTKEYTEIKKQVASVGAEQSKSAMGEKLDNLVSRGVMSQEAADKQQMKNNAAVNAVIKIYNKKLDAAQIGMSRSQYFRDANAGMAASSSISQVDSQSRRIYNDVINQAMNNMQRRRGYQLEFEHKKSDAKVINEQFIADTRYDFNSSLMQSLIPYGSGSGSGGGGGGGGGGGMDMSAFMSMFGSSGGAGAGG